jgi:hypothetical protein
LEATLQQGLGNGTNASTSEPLLQHLRDLENRVGRLDRELQFLDSQNKSLKAVTSRQAEGIETPWLTADDVKFSLACDEVTQELRNIKVVLRDQASSTSAFRASKKEVAACQLEKTRLEQEIATLSISMNITNPTHDDDDADAEKCDETRGPISVVPVVRNPANGIRKLVPKVGGKPLVQPHPPMGRKEEAFESGAVMRSRSKNNWEELEQLLRQVDTLETSEKKDAERNRRREAHCVFELHEADKSVADVLSVLSATHLRRTRIAAQAERLRSRLDATLTTHRAVTAPAADS